MVIHDFDVESVAIFELEAKTPPSIDRHSPLTSAVSLQFVQPDASQISKLAQACRRIESCKQLLSSRYIETAKA